MCAFVSMAFAARKLGTRYNIHPYSSAFWVIDIHLLSCDGYRSKRYTASGIFCIINVYLGEYNLKNKYPYVYTQSISRYTGSIR